MRYQLSTSTIDKNPLDFWTKNPKIIFLECTPCIALKVILQVFARILYLPQGGAKRRLNLCGFYGNLGY